MVFLLFDKVMMLGFASDQRNPPPVGCTDSYSWPFGFIIVPGQPPTPGNPAMGKSVRVR